MSSSRQRSRVRRFEPADEQTAHPTSGPRRRPHELPESSVIRGNSRRTTHVNCPPRIPVRFIELGALWPRTMEINREQIELVTPSGSVVGLATQARWAADSTRNALLMQQATTSRHQVAHYFQPDAQTYLRFFTRPTDDGTVQQAVYLRPYELGLSDLLFESPTRLWDKGTYALVLRYDGGEAVLPIELR